MVPPFLRSGMQWTATLHDCLANSSDHQLHLFSKRKSLESRCNCDGRSQASSPTRQYAHYHVDL